MFQNSTDAPDVPEIFSFQRKILIPVPAGITGKWKPESSQLSLTGYRTACKLPVRPSQFFLSASTTFLTKQNGSKI